jgi:hypothetical protein
MLALIRKYSSSIIVKIFLTVLALTFIFCFGISDVIRKFTGKDYLVKIGNVKISPILFKQEKAKKLNMLKSHTRDIDEKAVATTILHQIIWENIIDLASAEFGFVISDETMKEYISGMHMFRDEQGRFDANLLRGFLYKIQIPEAAFLESSRKEIRGALIKAPFKYVSTVGESDLYVKANMEKRTLTVVELNPISFAIKEKSLGKCELEEFYKNHSDLFKVEETRSFRILELRESSIEKNIVISEDDLKDAYEFAADKKERTYAEMKEELRNNLKQEKLQSEINDITRQIEDALMAGEKIEDMAKKFDLEICKVEEINAQNKNAQSKEVLKMPYRSDVISIAFSIEEGSDSSFSEALDEKNNKIFWLVHLDSTTPKHTAEFANALDNVRKELIKSKQHENALAMAKDLVEQTKSGKKLADLAKKCGRISQITPAFDRNGSFDEDKDKKFDHIIAEVHGNAFTDNKKEGGYKEIGETVVVYQVNEVISAKNINSEAGVKFKVNLVKETTDDMYQQLIGHLSQKYKVTINYEMLKNIDENINPSTFGEIF